MNKREQKKKERNRIKSCAGLNKNENKRYFKSFQNVAG